MRPAGVSLGGPGGYLDIGRGISGGTDGSRDDRIGDSYPFWGNSVPRCGAHWRESHSVLAEAGTAPMHDSA
jgi:hypothetical protein